MRTQSECEFYFFSSSLFPRSSSLECLCYVGPWDHSASSCYKVRTWDVGNMSNLMQTGNGWLSLLSRSVQALPYGSYSLWKLLALVMISHFSDLSLPTFEDRSFKGNMKATSYIEIQLKKFWKEPKPLYNLWRLWIIWKRSCVSCSVR